jgi:dihydropteroate synthase
MGTSNKPYTLMGILNVTPDSFFDGGKYFEKDHALARAVVLQNEGADCIDIGGASSRPGARTISIEEEIIRVIPVVKSIVPVFPGPISVDTTSSVVAKQALDAGATWINDIGGGRFDPEMIPLVADYRCTIVIMHSRGTPQTMQNNPHYENVVDEVAEELGRSVDAFRKGGVDDRQIILDPGIGFGKTVEHNLVLLHGIERIVALGYPVLLGTSRKSFIGTLTGREVYDRLYGTLGSIAAAFLKGVAMFRVHDVAATDDFLKVMAAIK